MKPRSQCVKNRLGHLLCSAACELRVPSLGQYRTVKSVLHKNRWCPSVYVMRYYRRNTTRCSHRNTAKQLHIVYVGPSRQLRDTTQKSKLLDNRLRKGNGWGDGCADGELGRILTTPHARRLSGGSHCISTERSLRHRTMHCTSSASALWKGRRNWFGRHHLVCY